VTVSERRAKDRDFVETVEGFLFCLVGYLHPPDRYTAYLKYTPAPIGRWARADIFYHRELPFYHVRNVMVTLEALARDHPRYVWHDPVRDLRFSFVPREAVRTYYQPEARLADLLRQPKDALEEDVAALGQLLSSASGVAPEHFGITGSILLRLHDPAFSDIDLGDFGDPGDRIVARGAVEARDGVPHRLVLGAAAIPDGGSLALLRYAKEPERG
jgi:predicted nucleotidyltransferase